MREPACYDFGTNMPHSTRTFRIVSASAIALLMIGGAYAFSGPNPLFGLGRIAEAQSAEELLKEYAAKDTDFDGLPDWQEALYGTDPADPESFQVGIKDGEAVAQGLITPKVAVRPESRVTDIDSIPGVAAAPASLTDRFSQALISQYLQNRGESIPTSEEIAGFVDDAVANLLAESETRDSFSSADVRVAGSGSAALIAYAVEIERVFDTHTPAGFRGELSYFSQAMKGDRSAYTKIEAASEMYARIARDMMATSVPSDARQAHLSIANAIMHLSEVTADMAAMDTDPVRALMGISLYRRYAEEMLAGFKNLEGVFRAQQVVIPAGAPGYDTYKSAVNATKD